ncbi:replicative DNA helicase [Candidatus Dojkabacteria bacterium]|nr:replicative DNA helicase [Candidatus Dojkabacteria bacterium]
MAELKLPPQNLEAERSVLGAILNDEDALISAIEILRTDDFYSPIHAKIYDAVIKLFENQQAVDVLTLSAYLKSKKQLKTIGGAAYIAELVESVPTTAHVKEYSEIIKQLAMRRKMIKFSGMLNEFAYKEEEELDDLLDKAETEFFNITEQNIKRDFVPVSELLEQTYEMAEELSKNPDKLRGIPTGFGAIDAILGGFQNSDLVILAARPSVGKTALALDFARHVGVREKKKVGVFSLEMSNLQLMDRLLAMQVGIGLWDLRMGKLNDKAFSRLADAMGVLSESGIYIDDTPGLSVLEMRTKARKLKMEKGLDMVIVDYLQLMEGRNKESRVQEVSEISRFLKQLARELDIPVIALSQLNRAVEQRNDKIPQLSDLRESGSIEQDADVVMFIHREELYNPETDRIGVADLVIAKHRNGPTGRVELYFVKEQARYREIESRRKE